MKPSRLLNALYFICMFSVSLFGCKDGEESASCDNYDHLVPEVTEAPIPGLSLIEGTTRIKIKKESGVRDDDVIASIKRGSPNYDNEDFWPSDVTYLDNISSDEEFWYFDIRFLSTGSKYIVEVYFDCPTANIQTEHTIISIFSPDMYETLRSPAFIPDLNWALVDETTTLFYFNMNYDGANHIMEHVSSDGLIFRTTPVVGGVEGQSHTFTITSSPPFNFPLPMSINHFSATGFDSAAWPESHETYGQVTINVDMWICDSWYTAGTIYWSSD